MKYKTIGIEIEVVPNDEFKNRLRKEKENIYIFNEEENIEEMVLDFKMPPDYTHTDKFFQVKKQKFYVPRTIGKPISKKKGGR